MLPIINFADAKEYELRLPLLQQGKWDGDIEGEIEFLIHFSVCKHCDSNWWFQVDVNALLTEVEIHKLYDNLKLLKPEILDAESTLEKWLVLDETHKETAVYERFYLSHF